MSGSPQGVRRLPGGLIRTQEFPEIGLHQNRVHGILKLGGRQETGGQYSLRSRFYVRPAP